MKHKIGILAVIYCSCFASLSLIAQPTWIKTVPTDKVIEWRRHIHQNPELSFKEKNTSAYVEKILKSFGNISVQKPTATSLLGVLKGSKPGKTVVFRADMDALPLQEETGLPYASVVKDVSHACGHDAHTAMLLGTAATLSKMQKDISGTVYFLFQHAEEEDPGGALEIIKSGALKGVDAFFGLHVIPNNPVGHIGILPVGAASTTSDGFYLTVFGKGSHGSMPQLGVDPIVTAAEIVMGLQTIVSRNVTPGEMAVVSIGKFQSGKASNVIPDKAELAASIRTISDPTRQLIRTRIETIVDHIAKANDATYKLDYVLSYPAIENDLALSAFAKKSATKVLGANRVFDAPRMTASEDFSYYKEVAPVYFMILGVGPGVANHNPKFNIDEAALSNGVKAEVQIILDYLNQ
ncbi:M20 metallopeptidase family protein [Flavobacterium sp. W1B]|uniref:M20 metallopeptidase family protein n=1 Tax=Flavobacterium sp. W1B TaxID=3394146 RepID=UPI0039BD7CFF